MGDLIPLDALRTAQHGSQAMAAPKPRVTFAFDVASPFTYLAAERADHRFPGLRWRAVWPLRGRLGRPAPAATLREAAERRAGELGLPLIWPDGGPARGPAATRVAALAARRGRAAAFVLAAGRLAYCGGFDLDDPAVIAEAAAAAGLGLDDALAAARDGRGDRLAAREADRLARLGATELPLLQVGRDLFCGEQRIADAAAAAAAAPLRAVTRRRAG
jgi:2-hydroxychromene-2-carboxylate isomerase